MNNPDFFDKVSDQISKYRLKGISKFNKIKTSEDAYKLFLEAFAGDLYDLEHFFVAYLSRSNAVIFLKKLSTGGMNGTVIDVKVILRYALICKAQNIILCHNHPSEIMEPSKEDKSITSKIKLACQTLDITLLDHIIISEDKYFSFADNNII